MDKRKNPVKQRLIVPVVLAITIIGSALAVTTTIGCGEGKPPHPVDAGVDTPLI